MSTQQCAVGQLPTPVTIGGTAASSFVAYAPVCGGTTSTGAWQSASTGIANIGYVLTSTGSSSLPTFQASPTSSVVLLYTATASNVASVTFGSTYITSTYSNYMLVYSNVQPVTNNVQIFMQVSTNNGGVWITTNYQSGNDSIDYNSSTWGNTNYTTTLAVNGNCGNTNTMCGQVLLQNVTNGSAFQCQGTGTTIASSTLSYLLTFGTNTATNVNAIKLYMSSGNINTGTFSLYGILQ